MKEELPTVLKILGIMASKTPESSVAKIHHESKTNPGIHCSRKQTVYEETDSEQTCRENSIIVN